LQRTVDRQVQFDDRAIFHIKTKAVDRARLAGMDTASGLPGETRITASGKKRKKRTASTARFHLLRSRQLQAGQAPVPQAWDGASDFVSAGLLPPLKSVAYQPVPFNAKPGAVTCLAYSALPHDGHTVSRASDTFCISSWEKPQDAHL
jgi:hypothetical protein